MENTNINDAAIKRSNIPNNWPYCFNSNCKRCNECIHFRSSVALDSSRTQGSPAGRRFVRPLQTSAYGALGIRI